MQFVILGILALGVLFGLAQLFVSADTRTVVRALRYVIGGGLIVIGGIFLFAGRAGLGLAMLAFGATALFRGRLLNFDLGGASRSDGRKSRVRAGWLNMQLDHDSGTLVGTVMRGEHQGRELDQLETGELLNLYREIGADTDSLALLEAYLDRRMPAWREHFQDDPAARSAGTADAGPMTEQQAYEILGLPPGAGDPEIRAAHRRLMKRVHPDQGGSTFLASRINEAKDFLLSRHR
jgi:hypothetical protein